MARFNQNIVALKLVKKLPEGKSAEIFLSSAGNQRKIITLRVEKIVLWSWGAGRATAILSPKSRYGAANLRKSKRFVQKDIAKVRALYIVSKYIILSILIVIIPKT